jgi:hypothetical protein
MNYLNYREQDMDIVPGALYEVWLLRSWPEARPAVPVRQVHLLGWGSQVVMWEVLVDGELKRVSADSIFPPGLATQPTYPNAWNITSADIGTQMMTAETTIKFEWK